MRYELLQGQANVFRFPVERRTPATLNLLREIAPDVREVLNVVEAFDLNTPGSELREAADAEVAEYILNNIITERGERRRKALSNLLQPLIEQAVAACRLASDKWATANEVQQRVVAAAERADWTGRLEEEASSSAHEAAEALLAAHVKAEHALGASRAVEIAQRGKSWTPRSAESDMAWLCDFEQAQGQI